MKALRDRRRAVDAHAQWRPDAILVCVFGQVIDAPIIRLPPCGIYNFHPSDLAHHHGAGLAPYDDLVARGVATTVWAVHGSGTTPVSWNSTGRLSRFCSMYALTPLA